MIGLGESHHYTRDFNTFPSRLFKYLVERRDFRVFVLECGLAEAKRAHDFVLGQDISSDDVFINLNNNFGVLKEVQELLAWMRDSNRSRHDDQKLIFYGMDGSEGWTRADTAIASVCDYLHKVDTPRAEENRTTLLSLAAGISLYSLADTSHDSLDRLVCGLNRLVSQLRVEKLSYVSRSSLDEFDWAEMFAHVARDIGSALAEIMRNPAKWLLHWSNLRDCSMARQLKWICDREGRDSGLLIGAHNGHLQRSTNRETEIELGTFSQYLATLIPESEFSMICGTNYFSLRSNDPTRSDSNQHLLHQLGHSSFFLLADLESQPRPGVEDLHDSARERSGPAGLLCARPGARRGPDAGGTGHGHHRDSARSGPCCATHNRCAPPLERGSTAISKVAD